MNYCLGHAEYLKHVRHQQAGQAYCIKAVADL